MTLTLRLYRELDGTEITVVSTRLPFSDSQWTLNYSGGSEPELVSITNTATQTFPGPSLLDLGSALSRVALYNDAHVFGPEVRLAQSEPLLLLNFLTQILLVNYVVFAPGQLTLSML